MVNLCLIGFSEAATKSLGIALRNRAKGICALSEAESADVALVDIDETQDENQWRKPHQEHELVLIAVSQGSEVPQKYAKEFPVLLKKPLRFSELLTSVSQAVELDGHKIVDIQKASSAGSHVSDGARLALSKVARSQELIDSEGYLLGRLLSALKSPSKDLYRLIQWWSGDQWLVLDRQRNKVYLNVGEKNIRRVAIMTLDNLGLDENWISETRLDELRKAAIWECSTEEFVWLLTQYTVRTGGLKKLSLDMPYRLKQWPDLARYSSSDKDLPLSSCWIDNASSVKELAEKMVLPMDKVLPFASCCLAIGFLQEEESRLEPAAKPPGKKGLKKVFSMILGKLAK